MSVMSPGGTGYPRPQKRSQRRKPKLPKLLGRVLCKLGRHDPKPEAMIHAWQGWVTRATICQRPRCGTIVDMSAERTRPPFASGVKAKV